MLTIHNNRSVFRPKQWNVENKKKRSKAESMFELQLSTIQELVVVNSVCDRDSSTEGSLDEATECFVVFKIGSALSVSWRILLGQAKRYVKNIFNIH